MSGNSKLVGIIMMVAGAVIAVLVFAWLGAGIAQDELSTAGAILGVTLGFIIILPLILGGLYVFLRGRKEEAALADIRKERRILEMVQTQGKVNISDVVLELESSRDEVKAWIYDLVGKGLFSGYINWKDGVLYSREASLLKTDKCPNCGGQIELAGKGVSECPFCGTEIYLSE